MNFVDRFVLMSINLSYEIENKMSIIIFWLHGFTRAKQVCVLVWLRLTNMDPGQVQPATKYRS